MSWKLQNASNWPTPSQRLLLRATLLDGDSARSAWQQWRAETDITEFDIAAFDIGSRPLASLLYLNLTRLAVEDPLFEALGEIYRTIWMRNQLAVHGLRRVLQHCEQAAIRPILLKGMPLALFYYGDYEARRFADVDVVVRTEQLPVLAELLRDLDYACDLLPAKHLLPYLHAFPASHDQLPTLDIHHHPLYLNCPPEAEQRWFSRAVERQAHGVRALVPDAIDMLLIACFHGRKGERHSTCRWIVDVVQVIRVAEDEIDWDILLERSRQLGLLPLVRDALTFVDNLLPETVPKGFLERAWGVTTTASENAQYRRLVRCGRNSRLDGLLVTHWWRYAGGSQAQGKEVNLLGFGRFVLAYCQWRFDVQSSWQTPYHFGKECAKRMLRAA